MPNDVVFSGAVEGVVDEVVLKRLIEEVHALPGPLHGKNGKTQLRRQITGYNRAARLTPWVVLVDLNREAVCAPELVATWLPEPAPWMSLRVVVRQIEAWLLGDRERLAGFLRVRTTRIPNDPERLDDPKRFVVELAGTSSRRDIRQDMVPGPRSGRIVGPAYSSRLVEFATDPARGWRPAVAATVCESLERCIRRMKAIVEQLR